MRSLPAFRGSSNKIKALWIALIAVVLVFCVGVGYLAAYVVKPIEPRVNNLNVGDVKMELTETKWDQLPDEERLVYPGKSLPKNPVIHNVSEKDNDAYVFFRVGVPRRQVQLVNGDESVAAKAWTNLFSYSITGDWVQIEGPTVSADGLLSEYVYVYNRPVPKGQASSALFESVQFANIWEGQLPMGETLDILVDAMAIQKDYVPLTGNTLEQQMLALYQNYLKNAA